MERQYLPSCTAATRVGRFWVVPATPYPLESRGNRRSGPKDGSDGAPAREAA
jgi:hypothetical protein